MKMRRLVLSWLSVGGLLLLVPVVGRACGCFPSLEAMTGKPVPVRENVLRARDTSKAVFSGEALSLTSRDGLFEVRFKVQRAWKGVSSPEVIVLTPIEDSHCGFKFTAGRKYLVYADGSTGGNLSTSHCTRTAPLENAEKDLKVLGKGRKVRGSPKRYNPLGPTKHDNGMHPTPHQRASDES
jgi:hypothetical protein